MPSSLLILQKTQLAVRNYLRNNAPSWLNPLYVHSGISRGLQGNPEEETGHDVSVPLPRVICVCNQAGSSAAYSGRFRAILTVRLEESVDRTSEDDHLTHGTELFNLLFTDDLVTSISNAVDDFTCFGFLVVDQSYDLLGRRWVCMVTANLEVIGRDSE